MQTFLPYPEFPDTAICLDMRRLGKQRVETLQILNTLANGSKAWRNHPAVLMWKGYERYLVNYGLNICIEWSRRGYVDNCGIKLCDKEEEMDRNNIPLIAPPWLRNEELHSSHRAALLYKNYDFYSQWGWIEEPKLNYFWPTKNGF